MKSRIALNFGLFVTILVVLTSCCQVRDEKQWIVYMSDFQTWLLSPDGTQTQPALDLEFYTGGIRWSPDGTRMAFTARADPNQTSLWVANSDGSDPRQISDELNSAIWLNDEILIASMVTEEQEGKFNVDNYTLDLRDNTMNLYSRGFEDIVPIESRDRWLAWSGVSGFMLYDLDGDSWMLSPELFPDTPHAFDASPTGSTIIVCQSSLSDRSLSGLYAATLEQNGVGEPTLVYPIEGVCVCAKWSPDGRYVALLDNKYILYILDASSFTLLRSFEMGPLTGSCFIWSPDSKFVAVSRHYGEPGPGPKEIARVDVESGEIVRLTDNESIEYLTDWVSLRSR